MIKKIANQCATFDGKGKLTVDDLYSVIKVQVRVYKSKAVYIFHIMVMIKSIRTTPRIHLFLI